MGSLIVGVVAIVAGGLGLLAVNRWRARPDRRWSATGYRYRFEGFDPALAAQTQQRRRELEATLRAVERKRG